jgi:EAL domain-containing protein (putative c-di-GMP-specific phosphodiesterase class I)
MYVAKSSGRNQIARYDASAEQAIRDRDQLRVDLRNAIAHGEFEVHYQPVISGDGADLVGFEALARWEHPTRGAVPPVEFIPLAEETGDIRTLGAWVMKTATAQAEAWRESIPGCETLHLAVNISPLQLDDDDFVEMVTGVLLATGFPANQLTLEITESMLVRDRVVSAGKLNALRERGIRIAIDDFGTGYSSLSYLAEIPADIVKIDQSFVADLHPQSGSRVLVKSIIDLARSLGLEVVAEGVEETGQAEILHDLGCGTVQGYLFARPMGRDVCTEYLVANSEPLPTELVQTLGSADATKSHA